MEKYSKEELKDLVTRIDEGVVSNCLGLGKYFLSSKFSPAMLWAYETGDTDRFLKGLIDILNTTFRSGWYDRFNVESILNIPFENIPLIIYDEATHEQTKLSNILLKWRLNVGDCSHG